jgi:uncharacterized protein (DUF1015 family)
LARIQPFKPYRYGSDAGPIEDLVTQPYDKISPAMQAEYLQASPYNLVRVILGERRAQDNETDNVYTRATRYLNDWIESGVLVQDREPAIYPYFQEFTVPDTGERLQRKGFIALGAVEDYAANVVHRHEQTLAGPKKDRLELLRHTRAHCELIFMLYPDAEGDVDLLLDQATHRAPLAEIRDEYGAVHRVWRMTGADGVRALMADKKLVIADGHHRYETALAFRDENVGVPGAQFVPMAFVNMNAPGLRILATHRLVSGLPAGWEANFFEAVKANFEVTEIPSLNALKQAWSSTAPGVIGLAAGSKLYKLVAHAAKGELDVVILHQRLLAEALGISAEAVRNEQFLRYMRGIDAAIAHVRDGDAQAAFLLKPTSVQQVADTSFGGGVMPQKSTDFYPKLLSGLTIYKVD